MTLARTLHRPFVVTAYIGDKKLTRTVWSQSSWDALDQVREQTGAEPVASRPVPFDAPDTVIPEEVVMQTINAQNRMMAARMEAETIEVIREPGKTLKPLAIYMAVSSGIALVALVHLAPMLIDGVEALWRMVGM